MTIFKISIQEIKEGETFGNEAFFFVNGLDTVLSAECFNTKLKDAKTGEEFTLRESILNQLKINQ